MDNTIIDLLGNGYLGDLLAIDMSIGAGFLDRGRPFNWRDDREVSGNNVMLLGAWYEVLLRQVGPASSVKSISKVNVKWRNDETGARRYVAVPDLVEVICDMASGPVLHMRVTTVLGFPADDGIWYYGTEGTLHLNASTVKLYGGRKGEDKLSEIEIRPEMAGGWRVEQEFVNAIRGEGTVTHSTFADGVKYMEFTDAVLISAQSGETVHLPMP
jgi:predicted dehydrogenase